MAQEVVDTATYLIVIGGSAGSLDVLMEILPNWSLPEGVATILILHRKNDYDSSLTELLSSKCYCPVKEAEDKESILAGFLYIAPADYHLLVETNHSLSLDSSEKINYSRPSIDASLETAAIAYHQNMACILLSGANADGTNGMLEVKVAGGITIVQSPETASVPFMPQHAIELVQPDAILQPSAFVSYLRERINTHKKTLTSF